jgi:hypothetical protein
MIHCSKFSVYTPVETLHYREKRRHERLIYYTGHATNVVQCIVEK